MPLQFIAGRTPRPGHADCDYRARPGGFGTPLGVDTAYAQVSCSSFPPTPPADHRSGVPVVHGPRIRADACAGSAVGAAADSGGDRAQPHQSADDAVDQASSQLFPADSSVRGGSAARRFRRARRGPLHHRQRRHHRARVSVCDHRQPAGRRAPIDAQQDDSDVRALGRVEAGRVPARVHLGDRIVRGVEQPAAAVSNWAGGDGVADVRRQARALRDARLRLRDARGGLHRRTRSTTGGDRGRTCQPRRHGVCRPRRARAVLPRRLLRGGIHATVFRVRSEQGGSWGLAIEKRTGGHTLQLNFTNSFGTTLGQIARGGSPHDVYLGFNITRKF